MSAEERAPLHLVSCAAGQRFARGVADALGVQLAPSRELWFACGEGKAEIQENVRGGDVYVIQSPICPGDDRSTYDRLVMMLHAVEAAALADAEWVTAVLPYYPCARQDKRKGRTREGISAGLVARMLEAAGARRVVSVEVHNEAIAGMFAPRHCLLENVYLTKHLARWLREQGLCGDTVVSPDVGGMERARRYAATLSASLAAISKERDYARANTVVRASLIGEVRDHDVLIVDDIIDTAGSMAAAIQELKAHGARNITAAGAHALLSGPAWARMGAIADQAEAEGWRFTVVGTSSVHHPDPPPWYREYAVEPLVAKVIRNINRRGSVTRLQEETA
ncbi:MAG: ribose-phosphate pyrophosphokinase [Alphaproteobacteria bacterium]|nr:ribose-phosphate pyrophosphokinase [Alphaproteobacteria bacterium]